MWDLSLHKIGLRITPDIKVFQCKNSFVETKIGLIVRNNKIIYTILKPDLTYLNLSLLRTASVVNTVIDKLQLVNNRDTRLDLQLVKKIYRPTYFRLEKI